MKFEGELEINERKGIVYFHLTKEEDIEKYNIQTLLRICCLPEIPDRVNFLDITHMVGCSWQVNRPKRG